MPTQVQGTPKPIDYASRAPHAPEGPINLQQFAKLDEQDLEISIGFGRGRCVLERVEKFANVTLIGFEIKNKLAYQVAERARRQKLDRLIIWGDDVRDVFPRLEPNACVTRFYVNFPDPWWKKRHAKRLVIADDVIEHIERLLKPGGELFVQTDVRDRAEQYHALLCSREAFGQGAHVQWLEENPYGARSNREVRAIADGLPIWRLLATRKP